MTVILFVSLSDPHMTHNMHLHDSDLLLRIRERNSDPSRKYRGRNSDKIQFWDAIWMRRNKRVLYIYNISIIYKNKKIIDRNSWNTE